MVVISLHHCKMRVARREAEAWARRKIVAVLETILYGRGCGLSLSHGFEGEM